MDCPVCKVQLALAERNGIEIDYCPQCRGVWLDRGELDKIIERASAYEGGSREPRREESRERGEEYRRDRDYDREREKHHDHDRDHGSGGYYGDHKRKKGLTGFLGDLFD